MKNERGFTLVEVIIAIALLGIVGVAFLGGLSTASKAIFLADERATAESLARTEMEYVMNQDYSAAPWDYELPSGTSSGVFPSWWATANHTLPTGYDGYTLEVNAVPLRDTDDGEQKITVVVYFLSYDAVEQPNRKVILEDYRSLR
jgi:prepilin-type N-terminal cleavage/methylation domain-containing protein